MNAAQVNSNRLRRFHSCGAGVWLYVNETGDDLSLRCSCCNDRLCEACGASRAKIIQKNLLEWLPGRNARFLTFTLKHNDTSLSAQLDRLYLAFSTMRRRKDWRAHVTGGAAFLEVKIGRDGRWHPHMHCLVEGLYWPQYDIQKAWNEITGDSFIVDIQNKGGDEEKARYASKYLTKPAAAEVIACAPRLEEFVAAIKGRRLGLVFGAWRGGLTLLDPFDDDQTWVPLGGIDQLYANAQAGDDRARRYLEAAIRKWPALGDWRPHPTPADFDAAPP